MVENHIHYVFAFEFNHVGFMILLVYKMIETYNIINV